MKRLVYLVGEPGAGKSTLLTRALEPYDRTAVARPVPHTLIWDGGVAFACELGARHPESSLTDTLPMNALAGAEHLLADPPAELVIGEGVQLARLLSIAVELKYRVELVHVVNGRAAQYRASRPVPRSTIWVKGQITRVNNLIKRPPAGVSVYCVDSAHPSAVGLMRVILELADTIEPAQERTWLS